ncbi:hypothetical protein ACFVX6_15685 [Streptomyces sp. NPDC058289]|uniref:hypothetical protein n=1 Tax=Streptomyces sp. NPDC058289 TaxID=3346425 RepID=UPI0036E6E683
MNHRSAGTVAAVLLTAATAALLPVTHAAAEDQLRCGDYPGNFYYLRATDGSGFLIGTPEEDALYHCATAGGIPEIKKYCTEGRLNDKKGQDFCQD